MAGAFAETAWSNFDATGSQVKARHCTTICRGWLWINTSRQWFPLYNRTCGVWNSVRKLALQKLGYEFGYDYVPSQGEKIYILVSIFSAHMKLPEQYIDYHWKPLKSSQCINICAFNLSRYWSTRCGRALCSFVPESVELKDIQYLITMMSNIHLSCLKLKRLDFGFVVMNQF